MTKIEEQLANLRLHGMYRQWTGLAETGALPGLSLSEGLQLLLQAESDEREHRRSQRLTKAAGFRYQAALEQIAYPPGRSLDKNTMHLLASNQYIDQAEAVLITGATGCGKSYIASALGYHACAHGYKTAYYNMQKFLLRLKIARTEGTLSKLFDRLSKTHLLILDDFGLSVLDPASRLDLLQIIEDRHARHATIITSQLPVTNWYDVIGEDTIADALLDRLTTKAHKLELKGESLRKTM